MVGVEALTIQNTVAPCCCIDQTILSFTHVLHSTTIFLVSTRLESDMSSRCSVYAYNSYSIGIKLSQTYEHMCIRAKKIMM